MYGRPGACYVDIAGDMVNAKVDRSKVRFAGIVADRFDRLFSFLCSNTCVFPSVKSLTEVCLSCRDVSCCPPPPVSLADHSAITEAISVLKAAKRPLVIIGKGNIKIHKE